jgi:cyclic beta-1,2-glucan synthetase
MPPLFARDVPGSLLDRSCRAAVARQIAYGKQKRVPWGISESAFAAMGVNSDYHYQSFGVPGLGLKRGLGKDLVISPYSTALAAIIDAPAAVANFRALEAEGALGPWGFYDAVDYTPERVPAGERHAVVYNYMAHHQGMIMVALSNCLQDHRMQRRFQRQPLARSTDLLLQERTPMSVLQFQPQDDSTAAPPPLPETPGHVSRQISTPMTNVPRAHLLANGEYTVMVTNAGGGYSSCRGINLTRWRSDTTLDNWGQFIYLRDVTSEKVWSATHQPTRVQADSYEVTYSLDKAEFRRLDGDLETHLEIAISPETNTEVRELTITNHGRRPTTIEVTSYAEVVLSPPGDDIAHPAFNKMFVETEYLPESRALLATRRPRDANTDRIWAMHVLSALSHVAEFVEYETDRARFLGRGRTLSNPVAMEAGNKLSGTTGPVLDSVFSLRTRVHVGPEESASLAFVTAFADNREQALQLADQYRDPRVVLRMFEMAWAHSQVEMRHLHVSPASVQLFQRLASAVMFPDASLRASAEVMEANRRGQRALWRYGISGDDPIVLVRVSEPAHRAVIRELLLAHEFWHLHGLKADLVIVNEHPAGYFDEFQEQLVELIHTTSRMPMGKSGGVYLLRSAQVAAEDSILLQAAAAVSMHAERGPLARQLEVVPVELRVPQPELTITRDAETTPGQLEPLAELEFGNDFGGFNRHGDYVVELKPGHTTPQPWSNVVANPKFGFLVTESGGGYTWAGNSRENKLTKWTNDPVSDMPSEIIYLRDEESGQIWLPTSSPLRDAGDYRCEHRRGSTRFTHGAAGIRSELLLSIAPDACMKFACLKLRNESDRPRKLSATYFAEWVLGAYRQQSQMHVVTERDEVSGALVARNRYHEDYPEQAAALHVLGGADSITADRTEFLGRNGSYKLPDALRRKELSGSTGPGFDPCGAIQKKVTVAPGDEVEIVFLLGWSDGTQQVGELLVPYSSHEAVHQAIDATANFWQSTLDAVEVETPNRALDVLVNEWLPYQVLSCRVWGRSAFYQSGGAYGFRDQLQDVMAMVYSHPEIAREVILQAASRQFEEGDVQHWWHPPSGRGVRTRFADDYLWLPYVVAQYVSTTGDTAILDEKVHYLHSYLLEPHEEERYDLPEISPVVEELYHHCLRAIDHGFRFGPHGLPLIGCGDWNDGMNKVGVGGQGESVWMGWFLRVVLQRFAEVVESRGDAERAAAYRSQADRLLETVESEAWDGKWYRRAYYDDGTPIGSQESDECRIDSIAQSWSVFAGADRKRRALALQSFDEHLVRSEDGLVLLLTPPFDKSSHNPGYIKGYPPGIRENGGQYTHASLWAVQALALEGHAERALELFDLINPIRKFESTEAAERYQVEPYVVAADVYGRPPHVGRGGWTWYTGSAAWMYRVALETILGVELRGDVLHLAPRIPASWPEFTVTIRRRGTTWRIRVSNAGDLEDGASEIQIDGEAARSREVKLVADGGEHEIHVTLSAARIDSTPAESRATGVAAEDSGNGATRHPQRVVRE